MIAVVESPARQSRWGLSYFDPIQKGVASTNPDPDMLTSAKPTRQVTLRGPYGELQIDVDLPEPHWFQPVLDRMKHILELEEGWDSYGAPAIDPRAVRSALLLLDASMGAGVPVPAVVPSSRGGVQLEWHLGGIDFELEVFGSGQVTLYREGPRPEQNEEVSDTADTLRSRIAEILQALALPA